MEQKSKTWGYGFEDCEMKLSACGRWTRAAQCAAFAPAGGRLADEANDRYQNAIFACAKVHYESASMESTLLAPNSIPTMSGGTSRSPFYSADGITLESSPVAMGRSACRAGAFSTFGSFRGNVMYRFRF